MFAVLTRTGDDETNQAFYEQMVRLRDLWSKQRSVSKQEQETWPLLHAKDNLVGITAKPLEPMYSDEESEEGVMNEAADRNQLE